MIESILLKTISRVRKTIFKILRADVCKYRPELGKIQFLKNPKKIM